MNNKYDQILYIKYPKQTKHKPMDISDRASQFMPFKALSGYAEAINEAGRFVDVKKEITEAEKEEINNKLIYLLENKEEIEILLTYFIPDSLKDGGRYETIKTVIKKINEYDKIIILKDKTKIKMDDILSINLEE